MTNLESNQMKNNKLTIILIICILFTFGGCSSEQKIPNQIMWNVEKRKKVNDNADAVEKVTIEKIADSISRPKFNEILENVNTNKTVSAEIKEKVKKKADSIYKGVKKANGELIVLKETVKKIKAKLNPDYLKKRSDSLYRAEIKARNLSHKRISKTERNAIVDKIIRVNNDFIGEMNKKIVKANEEQIILLNTLDTYAFMLLTLLDNTNFVKNISLSAEQNNFFETGAYELKKSELKMALTDMQNILIAMTSNIEELKVKSRIKNNLKVKMFFYIDGYSDSTPFKNDSYEKNKILSQNRANYIAEQLKILASSFIKNYQSEMLTFLDPEIIAKGHGEDLPPNLINEHIKQNDPQRRMIKITGYVEIE